jgi:hypothetical protein
MEVGMTHLKIPTQVLARLLILALLPSQTWARPSVDHGIFGRLLKSHVQNGWVDYRGFKKDERQLDAYLDQLAQIDSQTLGRNEQMAFYINAYNAWTIKLILENYPGVASIKDLGSFFRSPWKKKFVKINGETVTLDHLEHEILRPVFKDPRVHFAVNCASKSCPPLLNEPYSGAALDGQLETAALAFINDPQSNYLKGDTLYVSRIFKWFGEDFGNDIRKFVRSYARGEFAGRLEGQGDGLTIRYLDYDWSLNGK